LAQAGRAAEAISHFERAVQLNPNFSGAKENLERARKSVTPDR
jgi:hypothetical protein